MGISSKHMKTFLNDFYANINQSQIEQIDSF